MKKALLALKLWVTGFLSRNAEPIMLLVAFVLCAIRVAGHKSIFFQAVAHFFVCGLFMSYYYTRKRFQGCLGSAMTLLEIVCFVTKV